MLKTPSSPGKTDYPLGPLRTPLKKKNSGPAHVYEKDMLRNDTIKFRVFTPALI